VWSYSPSAKPGATSEVTRAKVNRKAREFIDAVLKPRHVQSPPGEEWLNYIIDFGTRWNRQYFYFFSIYACPGPNAIAPTFQASFARMEHTGNDRFTLSAARHNGQWIPIHAGLSVDECLKAIQEDGWFQP